MTNRKDGAFRCQLHTLYNLGAIRELTDGQLLERYSTGHGEAAELAFAALVERHGAMVMRACRAGLADVHDAHDAFQATFLILIEKARSLWVRDSLGPWLHQVAVRTAKAARSAAAKRRRHEHQAARTASSAQGHDPLPDVGRLLHEEIDRLPERYRVPIVLCDLEGQTCEQVARLLGRPIGTVKSWRARGRECLRDRLLRRGLAPSAGLGLVFAADAARAALSQSLAARMTSETVSASVHALVIGVLTTMRLGKIGALATTVFALAVLTGGLGTIARVGADDARRKVDPPQNATPRATSDPANEPGERWPLTLREAMLTDLRNSEIIQEISPDAQRSPEEGYVITPSHEARNKIQRFRAEVMASLRSTAQMYWALRQERAEREAAEKAVTLMAAALEREEAKLKAGQGSKADVSQAKQYFEQYHFNFLKKTSEVKTTELMFRRITGLPLVDNRGIVPVTAPIVKPLSPEWDQCLRTMKENQPEILEQASPNQFVAGDHGDNRAAADRRRQKGRLTEVLAQTTRSLARFFREIDSDYKQLTMAARVRADRARQLTAQQVAYGADRTTVDDYLDAVSGYVDAVTEEARFQASYNVSIIALEEAKGTLLDYYGFTVADDPRAKSPAVAQRDDATRPAQHESSGPSPTVPAATDDDPDTVDATPAPFHANLTGKTVTFQFTVGNGRKPLEVRGSFTIAPAPADGTSKSH